MRRTEKGITLVALIITIVVLLILAVVAIATVNNTDIIGYANKAADLYQQKKDDESITFDNLNHLLGNSGASSEIIFSIDGTQYKTTKGTKWNEFVTGKYWDFVSINGVEGYEIWSGEINGTDTYKYKILEVEETGVIEVKAYKTTEVTSGQPITFTVDNVEYKTTKGTTWAIWCEANGWKRPFNGAGITFFGIHPTTNATVRLESPYLKGFSGGGEATALILDKSLYNTPIQEGTACYTMKAHS